MKFDRKHDHTNQGGVTEAVAIIWEIAGPAATGKSTLAAALTEDASFSAGLRLRPSLSIQAITALSNSLDLVPTWMRCCLRRQFLSRDQLKWMVYLQDWDRVLSQQSARSKTTVVIDQGPLFYLSNLSNYGPSALRSQDAWWQQVVARWSTALQLIVVLDAPNEVLIQRLNDRSKSHPVKAQPKDEIQRHLDTYRRSIDHFVDRMAANRDVTVVRFDTQREPLAAIVTQLRTAQHRASALDAAGVHP